MSTDTSTKRTNDCYVGCSGWHYDHWRGRFYPEGISKTRWLQYYSGVFNTVELNNTFYRLPGEAAVQRWRQTVSDGFVFAVKGSRYITHTKRLQDVAEAVAHFTQRIALLGPKTGPVLWQLPPGLPRNDDLLESFLAVLPHRFTHTVEFRHQSWWHPDVYDRLNAHGVSLCLVDMPGYSSPLVATSSTIYIRFHGASGLYASCYDTVTLQRWADGLRDLMCRGTRLHAYFNNDANGYAVENALTLRRLLAHR